MIEGIVRFTEDEKAEIVKKRKERNSAWAKKRNWQVKIDKIMVLLQIKATTRFERLLRERMVASGYTTDEMEYVMRNKHFNQPPLLEQAPVKEKEELNHKHRLWKSKDIPQAVGSFDLKEHSGNPKRILGM